MTPVRAQTVLDTFFQEARCKLLDVAAILDRIGRGADAEVVRNDPRYRKLLQAAKILETEEPGRAEKIQQLFSLPYDPAWERPKPRTL